MLVDVAGLPCDVGVGSSGARFKSRVLGMLDAIDPRYGQLVRLVKAWAKAHGLNSPADGTFNTFALCLMVGRETGCQKINKDTLPCAASSKLGCVNLHPAGTALLLAVKGWICGYAIG